jgi:hypothetical protein
MRYLLSIALLLISLPAFSQQTGGVSVGLSLFPVYPLDGNIPADFKNQFVFVDPEDVLDLIVSFPEDLGSPDFNPDIPSSRRMLQIRSRKHVLPAISVQVTNDAQGMYLYRYTVANQLGAKQEISAMYFSSATLSSDDVSQPQSWQASKPDGQIGWLAQTAQSRIQPGSSLGGFTISSKYKPGFSLAYFQGPAPAGLSTEQLPPLVLEQLKPFLQLYGNSQAEMVIAPRYHSETTSPAIVPEFHGAVQSLIGQGKLSPDSVFIKEVMSVLRNYSNAAEEAGDTPVEEFTGPPLEIKQKPAAGLESEIYAAMKFSLDLK